MRITPSTARHQCENPERKAASPPLPHGPVSFAPLSCVGPLPHLADGALLVVLQHAEVEQRDVDLLPRAEADLPRAEGGADPGVLRHDVPDVALGLRQRHRLVRVARLALPRRNWNRRIGTFSMTDGCALRGT